MTTTTDVPAAPTPSPAPRKRSLGKIILKLFVALVLLLILGLVTLYLFRNTLVAAGVVRGGKYATDQDTGLQAADLSLGAGSLQLNDFNIKNLSGYTSPNILTMKSCSTTVESSSLLSHTVLVKEINIDGLEVTLEQNGMKNNLNDLMTIIKKKTSATGNAPTADGNTQQGDTPPGKELKISVIKLTGTKVHLIAGAPLNFNQNISLPDIEMIEPTNPDGRPMKIADLIGKILLHLGKQIVENPQIPGDIKGAMKNVTALVDNLRGELDKNVKSLTGDLKNIQNLTTNPAAIKDLGKNVGQDLNNLKNSGKTLQDAGKNLGNMFNKNNK